jgi:hypothetical protein
VGVGVWVCGCGDVGMWVCGCVWDVGVGELSVFSFLFIPSCLRRGGTPSPSLRAFPEPRPRASAFQLFSFQRFSFSLQRDAVAHAKNRCAERQKTRSR